MNVVARFLLLKVFIDGLHERELPIKSQCAPHLRVPSAEAKTWARLGIPCRLSEVSARAPIIIDTPGPSSIKIAPAMLQLRVRIFNIQLIITELAYKAVWHIRLDHNTFIEGVQHVPWPNAD